jgi:TPR repeat protein
MNAASDEEEKAADSDTMVCCACCGKAEVDDVKLKICTACRLVKYCSVDCQKNHRPQHKKACKKRAAEIRDDNLFTQPDESYLGECPICCLPLSIDENKSGINSCCCKRICFGCSYANQLRELEQGLEQKCPYCREPLPKTQDEANQNLMKRVKANDLNALRQMGNSCHEKGDYERAFEYWTNAAGLGDAMAHFNLSILYSKGQGVEKDLKKEAYHLEEAAIGGHHFARHNLGNNEGKNGRVDRAGKHYIIAAKLGYDRALQKVKSGFALGFVSKEDYAAALRGHQAAVDATKSTQRDAAEEYYNQRNQK